MIEVRNESDFTDYLDSLLNQVESEDLEFKSAAGGFPGSFWDTYSAFANSEGGTIILGVAEKKGKFYLDKLSDEQIEKYTKDFWNNVNSRTTISCNLMKNEDVIVKDYKGHHLMFFFIPHASREQKPVYRTTQPYNGTFKRNYEGDYKCTEKEVQRMFADANISNPADSRILHNYSMDDLDQESIAQYRQLFKLAKPSHPWSSLSNFDFLKKLGAYRKDRNTKEEGFTVAGLLMFGKSDAITDNECCPDFFPDYQEKLSDNPQIRWTNRIYPDGTWEANLFQFYSRILPRLEAILPKPFTLRNNIRHEDTPAHVAVREALINLCIHADYSENATMVVQLYPNKMVFSNPGTLLVSKIQFYEGGASVCRNKTLQKMFMLIGSAEKAGSGIDKILAGWHSANWRSPILRTTTQPDKIELTMMMESLMDEKIKNKLSEHFGTKVFTIGRERLLILNAICTDGWATNESLRIILNQHKGEVADLLKDMCKHNLITPKGYGRGMKYYLNIEANVTSSKANVTSSEANIPSSEANIPSSEANIPSSEANIPSSEANIPSSEANTPSSGNSENKNIKQRMSYSELKNEICLICSDWVSLDELSQKIKRNKTYLKIYIIPKLLDEKCIEMMFPGTPKHPRQKYKTIRIEKDI